MGFLQALNIISEATARLEHKLDQLVVLFKKHNPQLVMPAFGGLPTTCPLCGKQVEYMINVGAKILERRCNCKTGLQPPIELEAPGPTGGANVRREESEGGYDADADRRRG